MSRFHNYLGAGALAIGLLIAGISPAWAHGGGGGGHGGGGGGHGGGGYGHGGYGHGGYGYGGYGYGGFGFGYGGYAFFGGGYGPWWYSYYPWYAYYPAYGYAAAPSFYADYSSFYPSTAVTPTVTSPPAGNPNIARVGVLLPDPNAQMLVNGKPTTTTGTARLFETPELQPGQTYSYQISASWTDNGKPVKLDQKIKVTAGKLTVVDFNRAAAPAPQQAAGQ